MANRDVIAEMDRDAEYNQKVKDFHGNEARFFGDYDHVRIPDEKQTLIKEAFRQISRVVMPTVQKLSLDQNLIEIQDRLYNRVQYYTTDVNSCISASRNVAEVNVCCDSYIQRLNNDMRRDALDIIKDY